jgi:hypothetical protein
MSFSWYLNRLRVMSVKEILLYRIPQFLKNIIWKVSPISPKPILPIQSNNKIGIFNIAKDLDRYPFFDVQIKLSEIEDWNFDYKNNIKAINNKSHNIKRQDFESYGDVKYVSEISRIHFLPFYAIKYNYTKDKLFLDFIQNTLKTWKSQNPFLQTINWTSGIEVAIRSVNLIYTYINLNDKNIKSNIKEIIEESYSYIRSNLSLYSSANNHLIAELAALNIISSVFTSKKIEKEKERWREMIFEQVLLQINNDGVNMELSTRYHAEVLDHIINALYFIRKSGFPIPEEVICRVRKSAKFLVHVEFNGVFTEFGDNDEGFLINPYFQEEFNYYKSVANSIFILCDNSCVGEIDIRNQLIFSEELDEINIIEFELNDMIFKDSGYLFLYDYESKAKISFDFGTIGDKINGAHGHSDIFHFNFEANGCQYLIDSGTFQYHSVFEKWRNYFRSAAAHNTISITGKNHGEIGGRMLWVKQPKKPIIVKYKNDSIVEFSVEVELEKILWSRTLILNKAKKELKIIDRIKSKEQIDISYFLNFPLKLNNKREKRSDFNLVLTQDNDKYISLEFNFDNYNIVSGNEDLPLGWISDKFGNKKPLNNLNRVFTIDKEKKIETVICYKNA